MSDFCENGVYFNVVGGVIVQMQLHFLCDEIILPSWDPVSNKEIHAIGAEFFKKSGSCDRLVIPSSITTIRDCAFEYSHTKEVVWSDNCSKIPNSCFHGSGLQSISNIDGVTEVGPSAFGFSGIKEITWPSSCYDIPDSCFEHSHLERIYNIEHITSIGNHAFMELSHVEDLNLAGVMSCTMGKGVFKGTDRRKVTFPYYMEEEPVYGTFAY